jgi:serine/threonine protein kinase
MNRSEYDCFMSVAERIETAKNRLTADEYDELRRLLMPEDLRVVRGSAGLWYVISPDHHGSLQTTYNGGHSSCTTRNNSPWSEQECKVIFRQIVRLVAHCHRIGIYFGDFRLTKLVYTDKQRWVFEEEEDRIFDRKNFKKL